jgi:alkylation response protein AidB-like acyl-CoA dehydrogenase
MDFSIPDALQDTLQDIRDFVDSELIPLESMFLSEGFEAVLPQLEKKRALVKKLGLWLPQLPKKEGGVGFSLLEHGLISAELGRTPLGHFAFNCQAPDAGNMEVLIGHGTREQQERFLKPLLEGTTRSCFGMTEPECPGSNPTWLETTALLDGDSYVLNGHKWFASSADGAAFCIVMAVTDPDAAKHERASMVIVPTDTPGYTLERNIPVMGEAGAGWASHAELRLTECKVPAANLLGPRGAGFAVAQERLGPGRIHHCMRWIGICERALDLMCRRAATRQMAPGHVLGEGQFVQNWIAESRASIDAARLMVLRAAWTIDNHGQKAARNEISLIKFYVANVMQQVVDRAIQTHGALGMTDDTPLAYFYRHERAGRIYDGPDEVHKLVVAKRMLKGYVK